MIYVSDCIFLVSFRARGTPSCGREWIERLTAKECLFWHSLSKCTVLYVLCRPIRRQYAIFKLKIQIFQQKHNQPSKISKKWLTPNSDKDYRDPTINKFNAYILVICFRLSILYTDSCSLRHAPSPSSRQA